MAIDVDITIERSASVPGYIFLSEEHWDKILKVLAINGNNINFVPNHNGEIEDQ